MTNLLEKFNKKQVEKLGKNKTNVPDFKPGDTVKVKYKITEGNSVRVQAFEGVVIAKSKQVDRYKASFTVRKISHSVGVERKFLLHSPLVQSIKVTKRGIVRRGKLYYLRNLFGKSARIEERKDISLKEKKEKKEEKKVKKKEEKKMEKKAEKKPAKKEADKKATDSKK